MQRLCFSPSVHPVKLLHRPVASFTHSRLCHKPLTPKHKKMAEQITAALSKLDAMISTAADGNAPVTVPAGSVRQELSAAFTEAIATAFPGIDAPAAVTQCKESNFGDYQCNNAMSLFGKLKGTEGAPKNPRAVAEAILAHLPSNALGGGAIKETSLAGPGFINVKISAEWLADHMKKMLNEGLSAWAPKGYAGKRVIIDFSSPNVAKEMHVGHLRSTIIGDTLARTLEFCGADVLRLNHIGDWGTQFGMLIQFMAEKREGGINASTDEDVADLQVLYRAAKARFDEDEEFKTRAREAVTCLQSGNAEYKKAWERICDASRGEFQKIYDRLGVQLEERGESFYNPMLQDTVNELMEKGIAEESEGAKCVFVEGQPIPLIVQKSDGGFGYASTDMAALKHRIHSEHADWIIYVTDVGQQQHFDLVFAAAKKAGYVPDNRNVQIDHVGFGLVLGEDGKKFRSRSGDVVRLVELLDEAKQRCISTIKERRPDISDEELEATACAMGYGAVKYADLRSHRKTDYRFSFDEMLSLQGNTAVYLLYSHARIAGIVRKSGRNVSGIAKTGEIELKDPRELALALHIARFPEAIEDLLTDLAPNRLCEYLYDLSGVFNQFYTECQVIGSGESEDSRLLLCEAAAVTMRKCLEILGITPLYRI